MYLVRCIILWGMKALYVRSLTEVEHAAAQKVVGCSNTVTHRRARIIALSEGGQRGAQIAQSVGMHAESVWRLLLSHGYSWKQSKRRMSSPDPQYQEKKG